MLLKAPGAIIEDEAGEGIFLLKKTIQKTQLTKLSEATQYLTEELEWLSCIKMFLKFVCSIVFLMTQNRLM